MKLAVRRVGEEWAIVEERVTGLFSSREGLTAALPAPSGAGPALRLTFREEATVDGRRIAEGAIVFDREPPWPLLFNPRASGHPDAILVGALTSGRREGDTIVVEGHLDSLEENPAAAEAHRLIAEGMLTTWSPDIGRAEVELEGDEVVLVRGTFLAGTILPLQALDSARVELVAEPEDGTDAVTAAASGSTDLPVADRARPWDGAAAARRVFAMCTRDGNLDDRCASRAFFWRDTSRPGRRTAYKLGFADVIDGELRMVPRGVFAAAAVVNGARGGVDIPADEMAAVKRRIESAYARLREALDDPELRPPWQEGMSAQAWSFASAHSGLASPPSAASSWRPPASAFSVPEPDRIEPVTVRDGIVTGHLASWGTCHVGISDRCQLAPRSAIGYRAFHTGTVVADDGSVIEVGRLTAATGHASLTLGAEEARRHYEDSGTVWALARASDGRHGIWISGAVLPDVPEEVLVRAASCPLSGDWRLVNGNLELVAALSVPVPGFPLVASGVRDEECVSLVASGPAPENEDDWRRRIEAELAEVRSLLSDELARRAGIEPADAREVG
ncbi:MAG: hypothetical protein KatS3mg014_2529 [Actinomycetota bacterium]|nr:MAG: hypothetical protein KatS3mg014_2476 [Actinomycetota bacterium]GIV00914.1 MAG: hypothetical protein KatS3mg014_2529 [Actinomycetota bacterium]